MKIFLVMTFAALSASAALGADATSERPWAYAELVHALGKGNIDYLETLETELTKCGFGPGEEGKGCIRRMLESKPVCQEKMQLVLNQGCVMLGNNKCVSPPQAEDTNILYAGPRIHLAFSEDDKSTTILSFICAGD